LNQPAHVVTLAVAANATDHVHGSTHAPVTVVECADFECPSCKAAAAQGKFWPMHDLLFQHQTHLKEKDLYHYAGESGLDLVRYAAEMKDHVYLQKVREQIDGGRRSHIRATPTFFVNGVVEDVSFGMQALHDAEAAAVQRAG